MGERARRKQKTLRLTPELQELIEGAYGAACSSELNPPSENAFLVDMILAGLVVADLIDSSSVSKSQVETTKSRLMSRYRIDSAVIAKRHQSGSTVLPQRQHSATKVVAKRQHNGSTLAEAGSRARYIDKRLDRDVRSEAGRSFVLSSEIIEIEIFTDLLLELWSGASAEDARLESCATLDEEARAWAVELQSRVEWSRADWEQILCELREHGEWLIEKRNGGSLRNLLRPRTGGNAYRTFAEGLHAQAYRPRVSRPVSTQATEQLVSVHEQLALAIAKEDMGAAVSLLLQIPESDRGGPCSEVAFGFGIADDAVMAALKKGLRNGNTV